MSSSFWPFELQPTRVLCPWISPGKNTSVGYHALLQGIFLTQGSNLCLIICLALADRFFTTSTTWEALANIKLYIILRKIFKPVVCIHTFILIFVLYSIHLYFLSFFLIDWSYKTQAFLLILKTLEFNCCRFCSPFLKFLLILSIFFLLIFELLFYLFSNFFVSIV